MVNLRVGNLTSRRGLLRRGAVLSGAAIAAAGLPRAEALAKDDVKDSKLKQVLDRGKVIVGTGAGNPPWHYEDAKGKIVGMDIEMAKLLSGGLFGLTEDQKASDDETRKYITFVVQEANQRIPNLLSDKVDVNFQFMTVTAARALQVEFSIPYYREAVTILLPKDSPYNSTADMKGKGVKIAILQNTDADVTVKTGVPDAQVEQVPSVSESVAALDAGRVDGTAVDLSSGVYYAAQSPDKYKHTTESWLPNTYSASVKPGDQIWLNYVNSVIHEALAGYDFPIYQKAFKANFNVDLPSPVAGFPVEYK